MNNLLTIKQLESKLGHTKEFYVQIFPVAANRLIFEPIPHFRPFQSGTFDRNDQKFT